MSRIDCPKLSREMHRHYVLSTGTTALQGRQGEDEQEARSLKQMLKEFQQRQLTGQHAPSAKAFQTAPQEPESGPDPAAAAAVKQARVLMGYITSEAPPGFARAWGMRCVPGSFTGCLESAADPRKGGAWGADSLQKPPVLVVEACRGKDCVVKMPMSQAHTPEAGCACCPSLLAGEL